MIQKIKIKPNTFSEDVLFFKEMTLGRVNLLFGNNGVGKSTLISAIGNTTEKSDVEVIRDNRVISVMSYINSRHNKNQGFSENNERMTYGDFYDPHIIAEHFEAMERSEGESIMYSLDDMFSEEMLKIFKDEKDKDYLILLDEVDSGLSVDNLSLIEKWLSRVETETSNVQIVMAFNNPFFCRHETVVKNMFTGDDLTIANMDSYCREVEKYRVVLDKSNSGDDRHSYRRVNQQD